MELSKAQLQRIKNLALDAEIMHSVSDRFKGDLFAWYSYYRANDPKFAEARDWLAHVMDVKGIDSKEYDLALKSCIKEFNAAVDRPTSDECRKTSAPVV